MSFPDVPAASSELPVGAIQGSNYGGHAPLVGAHVFVLEGTPSAGGYYQPAKSLLNVVTTGNYPTSVEPAGTAVAGFNYVTTDAHGDFNVSGDYTCTSGDPVYLYAEGGNPETNPLNYFQVYITQVVVAAPGRTPSPLPTSKTPTPPTFSTRGRRSSSPASPGPWRLSTAPRRPSSATGLTDHDLPGLLGLELRHRQQHLRYRRGHLGIATQIHARSSPTRRW